MYEFHYRRIIMLVVLIILSANVKASTELSQLEQLSKPIIGTILQYLTIRDYFRFTNVNHNQYRAHYQTELTGIVRLMDTQYQTFITTRQWTDPTDIILWGKYSDVLSYFTTSNHHRSQSLEYLSLIFFIPTIIQAPKILCSAANQQLLPIETFFRTHRGVFVNERINFQNELIDLFGTETVDSVLPLYYDPLNSYLCFLPSLTHAKECHCIRVYLPCVLVFSNPAHTNLHIEHTSVWTGKLFEYHQESKKHFVSWFSITRGAKLHTFFDEDGFLSGIGMNFDTDEKFPSDEIIFFTGQRQSCTYAINDDQQTSDPDGFTTITAFYSPPFICMHHAEREESYRLFFQKIIMHNYYMEFKKI